jgi:hypothetical protein
MPGSADGSFLLAIIRSGSVPYRTPAVTNQPTTIATSLTADFRTCPRASLLCSAGYALRADKNVKLSSVFTFEV